MFCEFIIKGCLFLVVAPRAACGLADVAAFHLAAALHLASYPADVVVARLPASTPEVAEVARLQASYHHRVVAVAFFHRASCRVLVKGRHLIFPFRADRYQQSALALLAWPSGAMPAE